MIGRSRYDPGRRLALLGALAWTGMSVGAMPAAAEQTIRIGVIGDEAAIPGAGIAKGARLAVDEINSAGGVSGRKLEIFQYDDHSSADDAVRAFHRAVSEDKVVAVIGTYVSEIALALQPWAARSHTPFITTGAASNEISKHVHDDYDRNKFTFHEFMTSKFIADSVCDSIKQALQAKISIQSAVVFSEDAAWTAPLDAEYLACLPRIGVKVLDHVRFPADTADFAPLFSKIERQKPDAIVTGISHVGVQLTVQWARQQVPTPMLGYSEQATSGTFWNDTHGAAAGIVTFAAAAAGAQLTPKTEPFVDAYIKRFGGAPVLTGFTTYDAVHVLAEAIKRAGSTQGEALVTALEKTDFVGTVGRIQFYGRNSDFTHAMKYGTEFVSGVMLQWQSGRQVVLWPRAPSQTKLDFPAFVHPKRP